MAYNAIWNNVNVEETAFLWFPLFEKYGISRKDS